MEILVVGFSHRTAPIEVRELACFSATALDSVLHHVHDSGVQEVTILSTCNRTEIYMVKSSTTDAEKAARSVLGEAERLSYVLTGRAAVEHLFRVAAGLDSLVLGETEVLGQVRRALEISQHAGTSGRVLMSLFQQAVQTGRRARSETSISRHSLSSSTLAVNLARESLGSLAGKTVLLIGTGTMAEQAAQILKSDRIGRLIVASSVLERAERIADLWRKHFATVDVIDIEIACALLHQADVVIAATNTSEPFLTRGMLAPAAMGRQEPLVLIDLGMPRNIDPTVRLMNGVKFADLDDLASTIESNLAERRKEIEQVEQIVAEETAGYVEWIGALWVQPLIAGLRGHAEQIRRREIDQAMRRLAHLRPEDREVVEGLTQTIIQKLLHTPTIQLRQHAREEKGSLLAEAVRDLFNLEKAP